MKRTDREKLAATLGRMASVHGATVAVTSEPRTTRVECMFPAVSVAFDIDGALAGGILASWFGASRDLALAGWSVDSVNPCHRRKATLYGADSCEFGAKFYRACKAVADGRAFA